MKIIWLSDDYYGFPSLENATEEGIVAMGGDLCPERLINAYARGIFPWFCDGEPITWWSLDPRMIMKPSEIKVSHSLRKTLKDNIFTVKFDTNFAEVINACKNTKREDQDGTWITNDMTKAYIKLHQLGFAHSVETYFENELVGGLYGVSLGKVFFGESMFHIKSDASKVAFFHLCQFLNNNEFELIDAQQETDHLKNLGAYTIPRNTFKNLLDKYVFTPTLLGNWGNETAKRITVFAPQQSL